MAKNEIPLGWTNDNRRTFKHPRLEKWVVFPKGTSLQNIENALTLEIVYNQRHPLIVWSDKRPVFREDCDGFNKGLLLFKGKIVDSFNQ
jgi:hypothetical protein